jgi:hypothetical protein
MKIFSSKKCPEEGARMWYFWHTAYESTVIPIKEKCNDR